MYFLQDHSIYIYISLFFLDLDGYNIVLIYAFVFPFAVLELDNLYECLVVEHGLNYSIVYSVVYSVVYSIL
jgi:hypothetical protein